MKSSEAQALHVQRQAVDPDHDRCGCWCCCIDCDFDWDQVEQKDVRLHRDHLRAELGFNRCVNWTTSYGP